MLLDRQKSLSLSKLEELIAMEESYIFTDDPSFLSELTSAVKKLVNRVDAPLLRSILTSYYGTVVRSVGRPAPARCTSITPRLHLDRALIAPSSCLNHTSITPRLVSITTSAACAILLAPAVSIANSANNKVGRFDLFLRAIGCAKGWLILFCIRHL